MNTICIVGNAGKDPELKYFESGTVVAKFSVGVRGRKKDDPTEWFNCEAWGKTAETVGNYVKKGSKIGITGYIVTEKWTDRDTGKERSKPVVKVDRLNLLSSRREQEQEQDTDVFGMPVPESDADIPF